MLKKCKSIIDRVISRNFAVSWRRGSTFVSTLNLWYHMWLVTIDLTELVKSEVISMSGILITVNFGFVGKVGNHKCLLL